jgi:hypothetical protein
LVAAKGRAAYSCVQLGVIMNIDSADKYCIV